MAYKLNDEHFICDLLKGLALFSEIPFSILENISKFTEFIEVNKDDYLLQQGDCNESIYILLTGRLVVTVDGGKVSELAKVGDVIGEMSLVSYKPVSASLKAVARSTFLKISAESFKNNTGGEDYRTSYFFHKIFSIILTDKLKKTNQKAKHFETLIFDLENSQRKIEKHNYELEQKVKDRTSELESRSDELMKINQTLEQQKTELQISKSQIVGLYNSRDITFKRLDGLYSDYLLPLQSSLVTATGEGKKSDLLKDIKQVEREVGRSIHFLQPISKYYQLEKNISKQKVMLIDSSKKQQTIAKMALGGSGVSLNVVQDSSTAIADFKKWKPDIVFVDEANIELVDKFYSLNTSVKVVLTTEQKVEHYLAQIMSCKKMPIIISRSASDRSSTAKNAVTAITKLGGNNIFGIDKYLTWGVDVRSHKIKSSETRANIIEDMSNYFKALGARTSIRSRCEVVAEELLMNAIYDAPVDNKGTALYNHLDRKVPVNLKPEEYALLSFATDGTWLGISVEDQFGALSGTVILKYLNSCYSGEAGVYNKNKGGAGRGLHQIIENSDLVVFNVRKGVKTEVIALFNLETSKDEESFPRFHFFVS